MPCRRDRCGGGMDVHGAEHAGDVSRPRRSPARARAGAVGAAGDLVKRLALFLLATFALALPAAASGFDNTEPLAAKQWYFDQDAAWTFWPTLPQLFPI